VTSPRFRRGGRADPPVREFADDHIGHRDLALEGPAHDGARRSAQEVTSVDIGGIILAIIIGFIAGLIARAVVPGKQDLGIVATLILGLVGSVVGNLLFSLFKGEGFQFDLGGWWASIIGAIVVLFIYVAVTGNRRSVTR
jgi:uncharacterized membrane protein YeaQ/YmgE (transglycosylase-associated protein family)